MIEDENPFAPPSAPYESPESITQQNIAHNFRLRVNEVLSYAPVLPAPVHNMMVMFCMNERGLNELDKIFIVDIHAKRLENGLIRYALIGKYETRKKKLVFQRYDIEMFVNEHGECVEEKWYEKNLVGFRRLSSRRWYVQWDIPHPEQYKERIVVALRADNPRLPFTAADLVIDPRGMVEKCQSSDDHLLEEIHHIFGEIILTNGNRFRFQFSACSSYDRASYTL